MCKLACERRGNSCFRAQTCHDTASKVNWARKTKAGPERGLGNSICVRDGYMPHPEEGMERTYGHTRFRGRWYLPKRTFWFFFSLPNTLFVVVRLGHLQQKRDAAGKAQDLCWGLKGLGCLFFEIVILTAPSKAIVSLICLGTGGGSQEFCYWLGQKLPVAGQWWVSKHLFGLLLVSKGFSLSYWWTTVPQLSFCFLLVIMTLDVFLLAYEGISRGYFRSGPDSPCCNGSQTM